MFSSAGGRGQWCKVKESRDTAWVWAARASSRWVCFSSFPAQLSFGVFCITMGKAISLFFVLLQGADAWSGVVSPSAAALSNRLGSPPQTALAARVGADDDDAGAGILRSSSRRSFLTHQVASVLAAATVVSNSRPSLAADDDLIDVYFGCGCVSSSRILST